MRCQCLENMASKAKLDGLNLSSEEIKRLDKAFKDEEFRKLFVEYAQEISDPENRRRYEEEITQMERERGMDVKFVNPAPGYVIKTTAGGDKKAFINICTNEHIGKPTSAPAKNGQLGLNWSIPHCYSTPRDDLDKNGKKCVVYDVVFHPDTYRLGESNSRFRALINDTALDGIERQFDVMLDKNNVKFPKIKFKGIPTATVIRTKSKEGEGANASQNQEYGDLKFPYPYDSKTTHELSEENETTIAQREERKRKQAEKTKLTKLSNATDNNDGPTVPNYSIVHRSDMDLQEYRNAPDSRPSTRPKELVVHIELPLLKSVASADLNIFERRLVLESVTPAAYKLDINLPYPVDEENGSAKFDKHKKRLTVTLPVIPEVTLQNPFSVQGNVDSSEPQGPSDKPPIEELDRTDLPAETASTVSNGESVRVEGVKEKSELVNHASDPPAIPSSLSAPYKPPTIVYTLPEYNYQQNDETVSFILNVSNVSEKSVSKAWAASPAFYHIKFLSVGSGSYPIHYSVYVRFPAPCKLNTKQCTVDVSDGNVVVVLTKDEECCTLWNSFQVGANVDTLQEKLFPTIDNLKKDLSRLKMEAGDRETILSDTTNTSVEVTEMSPDKLVIQLEGKESGSSSDDSSSDGEEAEGTEVKTQTSESGEDIHVFHEKQPPNIHSILKARSVSESSDDLSNSYGRDAGLHLSSSGNGNGNAGESTITESDENEDDSRPNLKKSVSFDDSTDNVTYKSTSSVTSLHQTLKNKRKRARRKEQKRQRHSSTGSESYSSGGEGEDHRSTTVQDEVTHQSTIVQDGHHRGDRPKSMEIHSDQSVLKSKFDISMVDDLPVSIHSECQEVAPSLTSIEEQPTEEKNPVINGGKQKRQVKQVSDRLVEEMTTPDKQVSGMLVEETTTGSQKKPEDRYVRDEYTPETMLSWEDGTSMKQEKSGIALSNSIIFDLDED